MCSSNFTIVTENCWFWNTIGMGYEYNDFRYFFSDKCVIPAHHSDCSKRQNTVEASTFGPEIVSLKNSIELIESLNDGC